VQLLAIYKHRTKMQGMKIKINENLNIKFCEKFFGGPRGRDTGKKLADFLKIMFPTSQ
jgi:hypothetical protein